MTSGRYAEHLTIANRLARIKEDGREITSDDICDAIAELESLIRTSPEQAGGFSFDTDDGYITSGFPQEGAGSAYQGINRKKPRRCRRRHLAVPLPGDSLA
ncbi:hypothetical protein IU487_35720 [Nocardia puris]|uniref:hypothetical protein n=1 Tax=Nocardia puris TaxID=208602 RepID=UPI001895E3A2|nr:hypothetical protein [Nocardia puris]MBF6216340.1 hypothetical protein [Nocardia puris]